MNQLTVPALTGKCHGSAPFAAGMKPARCHISLAFHGTAFDNRGTMTSNKLIIVASALSLMLTACEQAPLPSADPPSELITHVTLVDGSGAARRKGAVRISEGIIIETGSLEARPGETVIDGGGLVLAPGFIDTHSHADEGLFEQAGAPAVVSQGITTVIVGQDGGSPFPLLDFRFELLDKPIAINIAAYSGHNTLRRHVMGEHYQREATEPEIAVMSQFLREDMQAGALGLATGLEYDPGIYSNTEEVIALASIAAEHDGRYISHVRSEDRWFFEAIDEIIEIGRAAEIPVQVSHIKLAMTSLWGRAAEIIEKMDTARSEGVDISADIYPYTYWQSDMMVLLPERDINDRAEVTFALDEIAPAEGLWFTRFDPNPEYVGKTLLEVARLRDSDAVTTFMELITLSEARRQESGKGADMIIGTSMSEEDIHALMIWPHSNICTDGGLDDLHPRGAGSFPRVLGRYVREQRLMSLENAIHKMTGLAAQHMGFEDRGIIRPGAVADLVLFDPESVIDHATPQNPSALSTGIRKVWVNGVVVYEDGRETGARPGRFVSRKTP